MRSRTNWCRAAIAGLVLLACEIPVQVTSTLGVESVAIAPRTHTLPLGDSVQLTATLTAATGMTLPAVTWSSASSTIASVSTSGLVRGLRVGAAVIVAASGGKSDSASVVVSAAPPPPVASVTVSPASASVNVGETQQLAVTLKDAGGNTLTGRVVTWGSSNAGRATVNGTGLATGVSAGTATITATSEGKSGSAALTVTVPPPPPPAPVASVTVSPASASVNVGETQQLAATLKDANGNTLTGRVVTWGSSNPGRATVNGTGLVTGVSAGTATITATSEGKSGSAALTVTVPPPPPPPLSGTWPNEPAGFGVLTDYGFIDPIPLVRDGTVGHGWNILNPDNGQPAVAGHAVTAVDPTAPLGSAVADFIYPVGMGGGWAPATMYYTHASRQEVYAGFWWKPSSPWQNHPSGVNKLAFWFVGNHNVSIQMYGPAPYTLHVVSELPAETKRYAPNMTSTAVTLGVWHRVEWHMTTAGLVEWWLDGVLQARYTGVQYAPGSGFTMFQFSPTWGGVNGTKTQLDHYFYNAVHLSGR